MAINPEKLPEQVSAPTPTVPKTPVAAPESDNVKDALNLDFKRFPFLKQEQEAGEKAVESKVKAQALKESTIAEEKGKALEQISAEDRAYYDKINAKMQKPPEFTPSKETSMEIAGVFSMIATMGVALGGSGKLSGLNAMNAMGGMLKGYQQGRKDLFAKEQATFDKEMNSIKAANDSLLKDLEQYQKLRVNDKEAAMLKAGEITAKNPGIIAALIQSGKDDVVAQIAKRNSEIYAKIIEKSTKAGISGKGAGISEYFPGLTFTGTPSQNEDKKNSINAGALSLATADDLKAYAKQHPKYLGRQGQIAQNVNRYYDSWKASNGTADIESMPDEGQPALIFAKKYAAYLVGYEKTLAGSNRGMTQQFQNRFNTLMSQDQFNQAGFDALMNEQMKEVARATAAKDPAITGPELYKYGKDIFNRAELPIEEPKTASATPKVASAADVDATAKGQNITVDEAKKRLKAAGFKIEGEQ